MTYITPINAVILQTPTIDVSLTRPQVSIGIENVIINTTQGERYEGDYEVTPTAEGLTLETAEKVMTDDLEIKAIPYYETSNPLGGYTVYIAGSLND